MSNTYSVITATGRYIPEKIVSREDFLKSVFSDASGLEFEKAIEETIQKFEDIAGIYERRHVTDDLVTSDIAYFAAKGATIQTTIAFFSIAFFCQMAFTAHEFAMLQRILPHNRVGTGTGLYNGVTMLVGGGLGPAVVGGVVAMTGDYTTGILAILGIAFLAGIDMLILSRFLDY